MTEVTIVAPQMSDIEWTAEYLENSALPHLRERVSYLKRKVLKRRPAAFDVVAAAATSGDTEKLQEVHHMWEASKVGGASTCLACGIAVGGVLTQRASSLSWPCS